MKKILVCILFILGLFPAESKAQKIAVKSNLLYDATTTMNLGLEVALVRRWTLDIPVNYNPWKFDETRLKHWGIQPELRKFQPHVHWVACSLCRLQCRWVARLAAYQRKYAEYALSGTSVWRRYFDRTLMDIEEALEH